MRILILCTGNSCRSQMAEGFIKNWYPEWEVFSAGTNPSSEIHPKAIKVMDELDIDISNGYPKEVDLYKYQSFNYVITVCDNAKETCPVFTGKVENIVHLGFENLAEALMKIRPDIPIVLCTGFSEMINEEKAKAIGFRAFIRKPLVMNDLANTIRRVLDGKE